MAVENNQFARVKQVAVIGTGLLGGSIGLGLKAAGFNGKVIGIGRTPATLERAKAHGCVDEVSTSINAVAGCQLVVLASPVATFEDWFAKLLPECKAGFVITDVGSTKDEVCGAAARKLGGHVKQFVGSHPMAGSEHTGPEHAYAELFRGKPCILTPLGESGGDAVALVSQFWAKLGMRVVTMKPRDHDWTVARISHLPHAAATALVLLAARDGGMEVASTGFRDTTRVASGDATIWRDIFMSNRPAVVATINAYIEELSALRDVIDKGDDKKLFETLTAARDARDAWLAKTGIAGAKA